MADPFEPDDRDVLGDPPSAHDGSRPKRVCAVARTRRRDDPAVFVAPDGAVSPSAYQRILAALPPRERRMVHDAVANSLIEGYVPDAKTVARLGDLAMGRITGEQYRAEILESLGLVERARYVKGCRDVAVEKDNKASDGRGSVMP
ncbi:antitoxin VbhA family protein [Mycobacteroides abscessus]|uniref:antitoxin VbhA family protein n=1 Tax=Mycobacteroides abscessus TaxID=36809 RepID=UPI0009A7190D|nr:antitoxin VbhA family protein [Mycobacteroides abscessus]